MSDADLEAVAAGLGIVLEPGWLRGVRANYEVSLRLAGLVAEFGLEDEADLAPVFRA